MDNLLREPCIISGSLAVDDRGQVTFANGFTFEGIRRFYLVENFSTDLVRAYHGHLREEKVIFVVSGAAIFGAVHLDNVVKPNPKAKQHRFVLSARQPQLLHIPAGYANGFRPLEPCTRIIFFSTATLEETKNDDYRFPINYWGGDIWQVEPR
ncbi:MAG: sugar epimerase [Nitrososphaerales archaeon]